MVAVDARVEVRPDVLAEMWNADPEAGRLGCAELEPVAGRAFLPGVVELIAIPLAVNVASDVVCAIVRRLLAARSGDGEDLEVVEVQIADRDRVIVVRTTRSSR